MKITPKQLEQIIKEELSSVRESDEERVKLNKLKNMTNAEFESDKKA